MANALKVGVFYDGSYFSHVSNYYNFVHPHRRRLHIGGLHDFIKHQIAEKEGTSPNLCHIIDAHFFRGRFSAKDAYEKKNQLYNDRVFDEVLMYNNVKTHYLPIKDLHGQKREKGIDVLMALETFELAMLKRYDVVVLVASDSDHVPLVRKLHTLGCKTMLLGWDFEYVEEITKKPQTTRTSSELWHNVSYPLEMSDLVEHGLRNEDEVITDIFVSKDEPSSQDLNSDGEEHFDEDTRHKSTIMNLHHGYGFIRFPENNLFFLRDDLIDINFKELRVDDEVEFNIGLNEKGERVARKITLV